MFAPSPEMVSASRLTAFIRFCERATGRTIGDSDALYLLSVQDGRLFWSLFLKFSGLRWEGDASPVCDQNVVETARFFPNVRLSYAENLLACDTPEDLRRPAVTARSATGAAERLTRGDLIGRVLEFSTALQSLGVGPGDRIVSVLRNDVGSVVAALGSATRGATFSSASSEMGVSSLLSRFSQLDPVVLIVSSIGSPGFERERIRALSQGLPTLRSIVVLDDSRVPAGFAVPIHRSVDLARGRLPSGEWTRFPFNHPLYILFSSGTTGMPKCIIHGAGGTLIEHTKEHILHGDICAGDKLFFHTSAAWMMWNWQLSALACHAEIVLYDGPVVEPDVLWRIVAEERVTAFGTSPPYLRMCQRAGYSPIHEHDLSALCSIMSTGAILYDDQFEWVTRNVGPIPVQSISGGTDIVGCFVLGNPNLPVYAGESQCRSFALDVRARVSDERPPGSAKGELVCAQPFPSRPIGLHGDLSGARFHEAYFSQNPGVWTHGDLIEITSRGTARMHGRTDGTMNVRGIRIGPAEIYRVLDSFPEIEESMAVEQPTPGVASDSRIVLLVVMNDGHQLEPVLRTQIRTALARDASPAHVPAVIVDVPELPVTHSGKRSEAAARDALKGERPENLDALRNPTCLYTIASKVAREDARTMPQPAAPGHSATIEEELTSIWERVLRVSPIGPDNDFFEMGGTSLLTAPLFQEVADRLGRRLPLSTILHAPTISSMATLLRGDPNGSWGSLDLLMRGRTGHPLFVAPGLFGEPVGLRTLAHHIDTTRAVYGLRARGLIDGEQPLDQVEEMADAHIDSIKALQKRGPYALLGYSLGGPVALEIARRLVDSGEQVEFLGMIDTHSSWACLKRSERVVQAVRLPLRWPRAVTIDVRRTFVHTQERMGVQPHVSNVWDGQTTRLVAASRRAVNAYRPRPYPGHVVFFRASIPSPAQFDATVLWRRIASDLTVHLVHGHHNEIMHEPHVVELGRAITASLPA